MNATSDAQQIRTVAVSVSDSPNKMVFGLGEGHLIDATEAIASHLLASGMCLAYGGDLRPHGFTELLFNQLLRYRDHPTHSQRITVTNYLAWPVHISMAPAALSSFLAGHEAAAAVVLLGRDGSRMGLDERLVLTARDPCAAEWTEGLTSMRKLMCEESDARIVLGGKTENYRGKMPGVAEEVLLSLRARQPVYLIGGFGGCTWDIAETMGLVEPWADEQSVWEGRDNFEEFGHDSLHNGLTLEENKKLASIPHYRFAVTLIRRGLHRLESEVATLAT